MSDPTEGSRLPVVATPDPAADPHGAHDRPEPATPRPSADVAAQAAADVARLLAGAIGLRRAVELAEQSRRDLTSS
ncbi:hypothetical protein [Pseudonocardia humida]|uniref:Uncharacterized protein n=1 Tax=Pseudonocardia humida TaxID=2800819 RepID=A0ABT1ADX3_9PSEU|nr:hypothetical protein [Pseudonocardia humida]MCO1661130.1 hypothetical protein [Pseudonocardia humida]